MFYSNPESAFDKTWAASDAYFRRQKILGKIDALRRYLQTLEERARSLNGTDARLNTRMKAIKAEIAAHQARLDADEPHTAALTPSPPASKPEVTVPKARKPRKTLLPRPLLTPKSEKTTRRPHNGLLSSSPQPPKPYNGLAASCRRKNPSLLIPAAEHNFVSNNDLIPTIPKSRDPESPPDIPQDQRRRHHLAPPPRSDKINIGMKSWL